MKSLDRYLDKDEILSKLGLTTKPSTAEWVAGVLGPFGLGLLVGAGIALLVAPKPGRELREDIRTKIRTKREEQPTENGLGAH